MSNPKKGTPRKFAEKIALLIQKEAKSTAEFQQILHEVELTTRLGTLSKTLAPDNYYDRRYLAECDNNAPGNYLQPPPAMHPRSASFTNMDTSRRHNDHHSSGSNYVSHQADTIDYNNISFIDTHHSSGNFYDESTIDNTDLYQYQFQDYTSSSANFHSLGLPDTNSETSFLQVPQHDCSRTPPISRMNSLIGHIDNNGEDTCIEAEYYPDKTPRPTIEKAYGLDNGYSVPNNSANDSGHQLSMIVPEIIFSRTKSIEDEETALKMAAASLSVVANGNQRNKYSQQYYEDSNYLRTTSNQSANQPAISQSRSMPDMARLSIGSLSRSPAEHALDETSNLVASQNHKRQYQRSVFSTYQDDDSDSSWMANQSRKTLQAPNVANIDSRQYRINHLTIGRHQQPYQQRYHQQQQQQHPSGYKYLKTRHTSDLMMKPRANHHTNQQQKTQNSSFLVVPNHPSLTRNISSSNLNNTRRFEDPSVSVISRSYDDRFSYIEHYVGDSNHS